MRRIGLALLAGLLLASPARADGPVRPQNMFGCTQSAQYDNTTSGATRLVTASGSNTRIYVCGFWILANGTVNVSLVYGTGGTCGTGQASVTPALQLTAQVGIVDHQSYYSGLPSVPFSNDLCIKTSAGEAVQAVVYYAQF